MSAIPGRVYDLLSFEMINSIVRWKILALIGRLEENGMRLWNPKSLIVWKR